MLNVYDHDRNKAGLTYIYPVLSRRAGGLSVGINLNTNNACNWACIYCQVPNLIRGAPPPINIAEFTSELRHFLDDILFGDFYEREAVPEAQQQIKDIAISGNGEPTTAAEFGQVIDVINTVLREYRLLGKIKCVLITNGSMVTRRPIQQALQQLATMNGEVWFKIDSATPEGVSSINKINDTKAAILSRLKAAATVCPTWIQTCLFNYNNQPPSTQETAAYIELLQTIVSNNIPIKGVLLYGVARPVAQAAAANISALPAAWFADYRRRLKQLTTLTVKASP